MSDDWGIGALVRLFFTLLVAVIILGGWTVWTTLRDWRHGHAPPLTTCQYAVQHHDRVAVQRLGCPVHIDTVWTAR